jgi:hypothetical protein
MTRSPNLRLPIAAPSADDAASLRAAAAYLRRAGTRAATDLLDHPRAADDAPLRQAMRDNLLAAADLCDGLVELHRDDTTGR